MSKKTILFLLGQLLFTSSLAVQFDQEVCEDNKHLPHEYRCEVYYLCSDGEYTIRDCPAGLHFNAELLVCDYPEAADCQQIELTEPPPPSNIECPSDESELYLPHPDCNRFYLCEWGVAVELKCPEDQHWNAEENACDWPDNANCVKGGVPEITTPRASTTVGTTIATPYSDCPPDEDSGVTLPHPDCGLFYLCVWGIPTEIKCPEGHHWNVQQNYCDWPETAKCVPGEAPKQPRL